MVAKLIGWALGVPVLFIAVAVAAEYTRCEHIKTEIPRLRSLMAARAAAPPPGQDTSSRGFSYPVPIYPVDPVEAGIRSLELEKTGNLFCSH